MSDSREQKGFPPKEIPGEIWIETSVEFTSFDSATQTPGNPETLYHVNLYECADSTKYVSSALIAEAVREQRLQTMKDIVKLLHLTNGKDHGIRCLEDCISVLEAASTEGGKGGGE